MAQSAVPENEASSRVAATTDGNDIELQDEGVAQSEREQIALPPVDKGYQAWLLLAGCFVINVLIWGV